MTVKKENICKYRTEPKTGFLSSEFAGLVALYAITAFIMYKGYSANQITDAFDQIEGQVNIFKAMAEQVSTLIPALIGQLFYTKKRSDVKLGW